jgi:hypothetical protein
MCVKDNDEYVMRGTLLLSSSFCQITFALQPSMQLTEASRCIARSGKTKPHRLPCAAARMSVTTTTKAQKKKWLHYFSEFPSNIEFVYNIGYLIDKSIIYFSALFFRFDQIFSECTCFKL